MAPDSPTTRPTSSTTRVRFAGIALLAFVAALGTSVRTTRPLVAWPRRAWAETPRSTVTSPAMRSSPERTFVPYLKGQTHAHSGNSPDSRAQPAAVMRFYASRGYDFVVITDHNYVTRAKPVGHTLAIAGAELTRNVRHCDPGVPSTRVRCAVHLNVLAIPGVAHGRFVTTRTASRDRVDMYERQMDRAVRVGGLAQLNHPNFGRPLGAPAIEALVDHGLGLMEIDNHAVDDAPGASPARTPEQLWDDVLSSGRTLFGVASDDAHDYGTAKPRARARRHIPWTPDHAFVMVRAQRDADSIRTALARGEFYASSGVLLDRAEAIDGDLDVRVAPEETAACRIDFIGDGGRVLATYTAHEARYPIASLAPGAYVRALVTRADGARAWVQPVRGTAR